MTTLKKGSKGDDVKKLQSLLGLKADGDFGPNTEKAVKEFQAKNGLTADGIVGNKTWEKLMALGEPITIKQKFLTKHITRKDRVIKYIVIHFTAGGSSKCGKALAMYNTFMSREASCDFGIDDTDIVQFNPDPLKYYTWEVGDGKGKYGVTNLNSIGMEICSNLKPGTSAAQPNHEGWYFTEAAINNAVKLTKHLMKKYNIPKERVIRHYDASRKACPGIIGWNDGSLYTTDGKLTKNKNNSSEWTKFKEKLK